MEAKEILDNLCNKDERNPEYFFDDEFMDYQPPRGDCACDNCFYGRDKLAMEILKLNKKYGRQM